MEYLSNICLLCSKIAIQENELSERKLVMYCLVCFLVQWDQISFDQICDTVCYLWAWVSLSLGLHVCSGCHGGLDVSRVTNSGNPECHSVQTLSFPKVCVKVLPGYLVFSDLTSPNHRTGSFKYLRIEGLQVVVCSCSWFIFASVLYSKVWTFHGLSILLLVGHFGWLNDYYEQCC